MAYSVKSYNFLKKFKCIGAECEDTCCRVWDMQVDNATIEKYKMKAPELLDALSESQSGYKIMKRDPVSGFCVKFDNGLCSIQKERNQDFLGDACAIYPRITRKFGDTMLMSATLSCPEIARLTIAENEDYSQFQQCDLETERIPHEIREYLTDKLDSQEALSIIDFFAELAGDKTVSPEKSLLRIVSLSCSLNNIAQERWHRALPIFAKIVDSRLTAAENNKNDLYNLLYSLHGLVRAFGKPVNQRFKETLAMMEDGLGIKINIEEMAIDIIPDKKNNLEKCKKTWNNLSEYQNILRMWLKAQILSSSFPYAGLGYNPFDKSVIIAVRFATLKLAITTFEVVYDRKPERSDIIKIIQSLSRFMDHLGSPELSTEIYRETGWNREARLRGLIEGY